MAIAPAVLWALGGVGAGLAASSVMGGGGKASMPGPIDLPQPPSMKDAQDKASKIVKARRSAATQSVYTNPLGVGGQADVARKTLLGQ